jgi:hypothetical protein
MVRNLRPGPDWIPGTIVERLGPISYLVETSEHQIWKRHAEQIKEVATPSATPHLSSTEFQTTPEWSNATDDPPEPEGGTAVSDWAPSTPVTTAAASASVSPGAGSVPVLTEPVTPVAVPTRPTPTPRQRPQPTAAPRASLRNCPPPDRFGW